MIFTNARYQIDSEGFWLSLKVKAPDQAKAFLNEFKPDKLYDAELKQYREKRSLDANAYFHVLVNKIAKIMNIGEDEEKINLVLEYGSIMVDKNGDKVGFKLPAGVDVHKVYKYAKWFDKRTENGKEFDCYIIYEHTHELDNKQMARLIDGAIYEAQQLGIETATPNEIAKMKSLWKEKER